MAAGAEGDAGHPGGLAEEGRGHVFRRRAEVGVGEDVEQVCAGMDGEALVDFELAAG